MSSRAGPGPSIAAEDSESIREQASRLYNLRLRLKTDRPYTFGLSTEGFATENSESIREQADRLYNKCG